MPDDAPLLDVAGLDPLSERVYLELLAQGKGSAARTAERFGLGLPAASAILEGLRELGLASRLEGAEREYTAVDPGYSLRAIADRMGDQVLRIREALPRLVEIFERVPPSGVDQTQTTILADADAVAAWYTRLQHEARTEFLAFDRPPYVSASLDPVEASALGRGVGWRAIYTVESFDDGTTWEEVAELAEQGEEARIAPQLPVKLAIVDRRAALVSLTLEPGRISALVTSSAPLIDALHQLFEFHWARSLPLAESRAQVEAGEAVPRGRVAGAGRTREASSEERALLALMAVGMKDDAIARQLQISPRTLRRRSQELMAELEAATRFQAGLEAGRRGWL
ncbi:LuxR C-terminal-related transcriptional regulator [Herbiconiux sp. CPCC 205716]|uniref:LuxR C-terminal-related transcriptional regulator n=1 Tax=Herbiconiux gentiana TaxID=2970912 RepID=A0ABT2GC34_9MICO|nr:helix-turn-helix domain-containing protein [Herbiconiux gentiana]MCS5713769.1 LuxR C-terminal-related transcriptional regulator [Herbiconiux gentiana]